MNFFLTVHGVGHHTKGVIPQSVAHLLRAHGVSGLMAEANWCELGASPRQGDAVHFTHMRDLLTTSVNCAFIEARADSWARIPRVARWLFLASDFARTLLVLSLVGSPVLAAWLIVTCYVIGFSDSQVNAQFGAYWSTTRWITRLSLFLIVASFVGDCVLSRAGQKYISITASLRRHALPLLTPMLLIGALPFVVNWSKGRAVAIGFIVLQMVLMITLGTAFGYLDYIYHVPGETIYNPGEASTMMVWSGSIAAAGVVLVVILAQCGKLLVTPIIKVVLDVFRYAGDSEYRARLLSDLGRILAGSLNKLSADDTLYLLGHSLGSVILVDFLLNVLKERPRCAIVLVTGGSPIRRHFASFFPAQFFPVSPRETAVHFKAIFGRFSWINVYRRRDPIGGALGLDNLPYAVDVDTGQRHGVIAAHVDYWNDSVVFETVFTRSVDNTETIPAPDPALCDYGIPAGQYHSAFSRWLVDAVPRWIARGTVIFASGAAMLALLHFSLGVHQSSRTYDAVMQYGTDAVAGVTHTRVLATVGADEGVTSFNNVFELSYIVSDGRRQSVKMTKAESVVLSGPNVMEYYLDADALAHAVRDRGALTELPRPLVDRRAVSCHAEGFRVKYLKGEPTTCLLPDYIPTHSSVGFVVQLVLCGGFFVFMGEMVWVLLWVVTCFGLYLAAVLLGLPTRVLESLDGPF